MEKHINTIAILHIGLSILNLIFALLIFTTLKVIIGFIDDQGAEMILSIIANIFAILFIILSLPGILAGIGLYRRHEWARIVTLVLSVFHLFAFPIGTAIGIYSIWGLVQPEVIAEFNKPANYSQRNY